jgi:hypothetical protein
MSKSDNGIAPVLPYVPPAQTAGSANWLLEWLEASGVYEYPTLRGLATSAYYTRVDEGVGRPLWHCGLGARPCRVTHFFGGSGRGRLAQDASGVPFAPSGCSSLHSIARSNHLAFFSCFDCGHA